MASDDNVIDAEIVENLPAYIEPETRTHQGDEPIEAERDWPHGPTPERRCVAHKKNGDQCKNAAIKGATVCRFHGGAARHVKAAARARLENAADLMAQQLLGIALTAESEAVKLAAIRDALDRAGLKPPAEVVLSRGNPKPYEEVFESIVGGSRAESRRARGLPATDNTFDAWLPPTQSNVEAQTGSSTEPPPAESLLAQPSMQSGGDAPSQPPRFGAEKAAQAPVRHIQGDDALRFAALSREDLDH